MQIGTYGPDPAMRAPREVPGHRNLGVHLFRACSQETFSRKDPSSLLETLYSQGYSEQVFAAMSPGSGASSGRWHLPSIEHTTTDDKCRAFLCSPMRAAPHHPRDFVQRVLGREESWIIEIESETGEKRCIQKYFSLAVALNAVVATAFLCEGLSSRSPPK